MAAGANVRGSAVKALQKEFKELAETPVEGFKVALVDESNLFVWDVAIFGPPQTLYEGGYFKARLSFPPDYPYNPPTMRFINPMFHPNIFENGNVCISILHSPGEDLFSDEHPSEQWNPTQNVRTILLSVISLLNEPNIHSAAHVDASVAYRKWVESKGMEKAYEQRVRELVERTKLDAKWDGVIVPTTLEEYCFASRQQQSAAKSRQESGEAMLLDEDDDYCFCGDYDEELEEFDEIYGDVKDPDEVVESEDEVVACHRVPNNSLPSKNGITSPSVKSSMQPNSPSTSFKS
uniref:Ubiquitin conjugating enzyme e2 r1 n=1 Tax=Echinococcus granulosus TaxID=6210 RepID=A0A068WB04_ECHGR|nr:ubiquitin conjugating enzyme e2 r1 [Echinococcus granulosus]